MKSTLLPVLLLVACVPFVLGKSCADEKECDPAQCCVAAVTSQMINRGVCRRLSRQGDRCREPESKSDYYGGKFLHFCPCEDGSACLPYRLKEGETDKVRIRNSLRCQKQAKTSKKPDGTTLDSGKETKDITKSTEAEIVASTEGTTIDLESTTTD